MLSYLRNYLYKKDKPKIYSSKKKLFLQKKIRNYKKKYYIIKRNRWHGMFSNLHYVLSHLILAKKNKYKPIIDMENFPTIYNEKKRIDDSFNSWHYYFKKFTKKNINSIYKNNNFIYSDSSNLDTSKIKKNEYSQYKKILKNDLIKNKIIKKAERFENKFFKNKKVLGIHLRGSDQKKAALHPFPPTYTQVEAVLKKIQIKNKFDIIYLVTEEKKYVSKFKSKLGNKLICFPSFRSNHDIFSIYPRKNHRYLLGLETIINMILLSKVDHLIHSNTNFSAMANHFSNKKIKQTIIFNGYNSKNIFLANMLWYLKSILPSFLGGFKTRITNIK